MFKTYYLRFNKLLTTDHATYENAMQFLIRGANALNLSDIGILNTQTQHFTVVNTLRRSDWLVTIAERMEGFEYVSESFDNKWDHEGE